MVSAVSIRDSLVLSSSGYRVVSLLSRYELQASSGMYGCYGSLMAGLWVPALWRSISVDEYLTPVEVVDSRVSGCQWTCAHTSESTRSSPFGWRIWGVTEVLSTDEEGMRHACIGACVDAGTSVQPQPHTKQPHVPVDSIQLCREPRVSTRSRHQQRSTA